jgi:hypothetical protein
VDVSLQADLLAHLAQVLTPHLPVLRIMEQQVSKLGSLLHQMRSGEAGTPLHEPGDSQHLTQHDSRVVEAQRLVEVAGQQIAVGAH